MKRRHICSVSKDDHLWQEGLNGDISCAMCHNCPSYLDALQERDRLAKLLEAAEKRSTT